MFVDPLDSLNFKGVYRYVIFSTSKQGVDSREK